MPKSALFKEVRDGGTYALLTLFPPAGAGAEQSRLPREVVYVIDTSGSMEGESIQQARKALLLAIDRLKAGERFNVIQFNSVTSVLFPEARPVTDETRGAARDFVSRRVATGGTEMAAALEAALDSSDDPKRVRQVVFLTDGSVGNEDALFGLIPAAARRHAPLHRGDRRGPQRALHDQGRRVRPRDVHLHRQARGGGGEDEPPLQGPRKPGADRHRGALAGDRGC